MYYDGLCTNIYFIANCSGGCLNGGNCTLPDLCECPPGWTGNDCGIGEKIIMLAWVVLPRDHFQDINECNGDHECDQVCNNTFGSYLCSCDDGYLLQSDGRTCEGKLYCINCMHSAISYV